MDFTSTEQHTLTIRRLRAEYLVPARHSSPERVRTRLDEAVIRSLPQTLAAMAQQWVSSSSDSRVLLIRRLEIDLAVNLAWDRDVLSRTWAAQIIHSLEEIRRGNGTDDNVVWFADRAAYLAHFLVDVAHGSAWGKWYYEPFDGLRLLPTSAALRTALCEQPATGLAALLQVHDLPGVLQALTVQDVRRVVERLAEDVGGGEEWQCFQALWAAWDAAKPGPLQAAYEWHNALRLYLQVSRNQVELAGVTLKTTALALLRLARRCSSTSVATITAILTALQHRDMAGLYVTAGTGDAEVLLPLMHCPPDWLQVVGTALRSRYTDDAVDTAIMAGERRYTPFGSLFLLLPMLDEVPLEQATYLWPDIQDIPVVALIRFLLFVKCCGQARAHHAFSDPLVRDLLGIGPVLSPSHLAHWQRRLSGENLETFLYTLSTWQYERGAVDGHRLVLARGTLPGSSIALLLDCRRGVWLDAVGYRQSKLDSLLERFQGQLLEFGQNGTVLLSEESFLETMRAAYSSLPIEALHGDATTQMAEEEPVVKDVLTRLDKLSSELSYLALPTTLRLSRSVDLALSVAAQGILRAFAWLLPGFARSSLPYLYANFLDVAGSIEDEPTRYVVRLGRPPLDFILNITGMARCTYRVSWHDERPFALFQEEE